MSRNLRITFERILCPTDLTEDSDDALPYAIALAEAYGAKLFVLHCVQGQALPAYAYSANIDRHIEHSILKRFVEPPIFDWEAVVVEADPFSRLHGAAAARRPALL